MYTYFVQFIIIHIHIRIHILIRINNNNNNNNKSVINHFWDPMRFTKQKVLVSFFIL